MMRFFLLPVLSLAAALPVCADSPNLVENGHFDQMKDDAPTVWSHTPAQPGLISFAFPTEKERGRFAQVELQRSGEKGAYFSQSITVKPNTRYRLSLLARLNKGKITFAVIGAGAAGPKKLNLRILGEPSTRMPMEPLFWNADWYKNLSFVAGQWRPVSLEFNSGELSQIYISFGAYFTAGSYAFDDVSVVELGPVAVNQ